MRFFDATMQFKDGKFLQNKVVTKLGDFLTTVGKQALINGIYINSSNRAKVEFSVDGEPYRCFIDLSRYHLSASAIRLSNSLTHEELAKLKPSIYDIRGMCDITEENRAQHFNMQYDLAFRG